MTLEQVKEEYPDFDSYRRAICNTCTANDWYCPSLCDDLLKASRMPFKDIQKALARHDGDIVKTIRYIKQRKEG